MSQKKNYSRSFIILQENEKGYEISSDKLPTGYAKIEIKNGKCKVSFYVQNLKKMSKPYSMLLVCDKKNTKKLIHLGKINIDEYGRSEISREFEESDIAGSGIPVDRVVGASIAQVIEDNIIAVMSGFNASDVSDSWKTYPVAQVKKETDETNKVSENIEQSHKDDIRKDEAQEAVSKKKENTTNVFDEYEKRVQAKADKQDEEVNKVKEVNAVKEVKEVKEVNAVKEVKSENTEISKEKTKEKTKERHQDKRDNAQEDSVQDSSSEDESNNNVEETSTVEGINKLEDNDNTDEINKVSDIEDNNYDSYQSVNEDEEDLSELPKGRVGKFFRSLTNGLEDLGDVFPDVKRCQWYKISSEYPQNMFDSQSYNRYAVIYYPMLMYYPYIEKYGHYLLGYKCDKNDNMKYIVYAVPGTKKRTEQPFGGKTGFVSWIPLVDGDEKEDSLGYWLMFYDFKNATIAVPKR
ncbi:MULTISPECIES: hypothetical protein [Clostridium]|uniref:hypothetical protein n=1 Tax=Clostridium TaxID=1485 RepID=UPI000825E0FA|nr:MULTISPECIES: hypothetical protein [Clostridium]PJI09022.1 hypothetical protein CUB90_14605 [Clostridium sp. CT7]